MHLVNIFFKISLKIAREYKVIVEFQDYFMFMVK